MRLPPQLATGAVALQAKADAPPAPAHHPPTSLSRPRPFGVTRQHLPTQVIVGRALRLPRQLLAANSLGQPGPLGVIRQTPTYRRGVSNTRNLRMRADLPAKYVF